MINISYNMDFIFYDVNNLSIQHQFQKLMTFRINLNFKYSFKVVQMWVNLYQNSNSSYVKVLETDFLHSSIISNMNILFSIFSRVLRKEVPLGRPGDLAKDEWKKIDTDLKVNCLDAVSFTYTPHLLLFINVNGKTIAFKKRLTSLHCLGLMICEGFQKKNKYI